MPSVHLTLARRLRHAMLAQPRQSKQVAARAGYSDGYLRSLMCGEGNPTIGAVWALAEALDADPLWLLGGPGEVPALAKRPPLSLTFEQWAQIGPRREAGATWRQIADDCGCCKDSLRSAWRRRKLSTDVATADCVC